MEQSINPTPPKQQTSIESPTTNSIPPVVILETPTPAPQISVAPPSAQEILANPPSTPVLTALPPPPPPGPEISATHPRWSDPEQKLTVETKLLPPSPLRTPAEILKLDGKDRTKAEKCLANAIYFESRGEPVRGQIAVAQVVMNRVFSPYYPKDVCGVVYQNAERHLSCQFTFACDGKSKAINDRGAWARAMRISKLTLDGKVWLSAVAKSTHYHAYWVNPTWVAEMKTLFRFGVHTFYRPHRWGDGSKESGWVFSPLPSQPATSVAQTMQPAVTAHPPLPKPRPKAAQAKVDNAQAKVQPAVNNAKPAPANNQSKPTPVNIKPSALNSQAKPKSASTAPMREISAQ